MDHEKSLTWESAVSSAVSRSDSELESRLPPSYADILAQVQHAPSSSSSKKEIYDFLCNGVLLGDGTKRYWLDRETGGICQSVGARGLAVTWGNDPRYWNWGQRRQGSRFSDVAYLEQVCWLEVKGSLQCYLHPGTYTLSWRLCYESHRHIDPLQFSLKVTDHEPVNTQCRLTASGAVVSPSNNEGQQLLAWRWDAPGWMEVDVGEFSVANKDLPVDVNFSMRETNDYDWKSGLYLDGIVIRPLSLSARSHRDGIVMSPSSVSPKKTITCQLEDLEVPLQDYSWDDDDLDGPKSVKGADDGTSKLGPVHVQPAPAPAPPQGDHVDSQLEQSRGEIDALKGAYGRLENAMQASQRTYAQLNDEHKITLAEVYRVRNETTALEAEKASLQEQLAKAEANVRDKNLVVVAVKSESERLTSKVLRLETKLAQVEQIQASHENEKMKLSKEIEGCKAILTSQERVYKAFRSESNARIEELVSELSILKTVSGKS